MTRWKAFITTQSNRLEVVEFESVNINRDDAIAQCKSMYGAKEVQSCNPISTYRDDSSRSSLSIPVSNSGSGCAFYAFLILVGLYYLHMLLEFLYVTHAAISIPLTIIALGVWIWHKLS